MVGKLEMRGEAAGARWAQELDSAHRRVWLHLSHSGPLPWQLRAWHKQTQAPDVAHVVKQPNLSCPLTDEMRGQCITMRMSCAQAQHSA
jgi:hypothetical protein